MIFSHLALGAMYPVAVFFSIALTAGASPALVPRAYNGSGSGLTVVDATWDGSCFYPKGDPEFRAERYVGRWYQVASSRIDFIGNNTCIFAQYSLNENGTINVFNQAESGTRRIDIRGIASPVNPSYGGAALRVEFPGSDTSSCPGPNYIVQEYEKDWAIVQSANFSTMFLLSRRQGVPDATIDTWLKRAERLGTDLSNVDKTPQTGCRFT